MKTYKDWKKKFKKEDGGGGAGGGAGGGSGGAVAANNVGSGNIAGVGVGPAGEPGVSPVGQGFGKEKRKKLTTKASTITGMLKTNIKENNDNNNVILKQVLDGLDKVDIVIDTMNTLKKEIKIVQEQPKKSFKKRYKL
jgi:hypothetical protein